MSIPTDNDAPTPAGTILGGMSGSATPLIHCPSAKAHTQGPSCCASSLVKASWVLLGCSILIPTMMRLFTVILEFWVGR